MATRASYRLVKEKSTNLIQPPKGKYDRKGNWVQGDPVISTAMMNIQPIKGNRLVTLPDAFRSQESIMVFTNYPLRSLEAGQAGYKGDLIVHRGLPYRVHIVQPYTMGVRDHVEAYAIREDLLTNSAEKIAFDALQAALEFEITEEELRRVANIEFPERLGI